MTEPQREDWFWGSYVYKHLQDMLAQVKRYLEWNDRDGDHIQQTTIPMAGDDGFWTTRLTILHLGKSLPDPRRNTNVKVVVATTVRGLPTWSGSSPERKAKPDYDRELAQYLSTLVNGSEAASEADGSGSFYLTVFAAQ
jgi:hypothetical protein